MRFSLISSLSHGAAVLRDLPGANMEGTCPGLAWYADVSNLCWQDGHAHWLKEALLRVGQQPMGLAATRPGSASKAQHPHPAIARGAARAALAAPSAGPAVANSSARACAWAGGHAGACSSACGPSPQHATDAGKPLDAATTGATTCRLEHDCDGYLALGACPRHSCC